MSTANSANNAQAGLRQQLRRPVSLGRRIWEGVIRALLAASASLSLAITLAIVILLVAESVRFFRDEEFNPGLGRPPVTLRYFLTGTKWSAGFQGEKYGMLPLLVGTLMVALIAGLLALPTGVITAIFLSEYAGPRIRAVLKPVLEILAGIPTVVYGYFALTTITPLLQQFLPGVHANNQLSGGIVVGIMILPMVTSLSEDSLRAVPQALRDASFALGANRFETATRVVLPAALSGVIASFLLALARAVGETMAVTLACGGKAQLTFDPRIGAATITSYIATVATGDVMHSGTHFQSLFALALVLFCITLAMNLLGVLVLRRYRQVYV